MRQRWMIVGLAVLAGVSHAGGELIASPEPGWPQWRGPRRDGSSLERGLLSEWPAGGPKEIWSVTKLGQGWSSPVISGGRIFLTGDTNGMLVVYAFDLAGGPLWQATNGAAWTNAWPGARAACAVSDGRVFNLSAHGRVAAFDAGTGRELWAVNVLERFGGRNITWALSECLLVDGERVVVTAGGAKALLAALDVKTGATVWQSEPLRLADSAGEADGAGYASPILFSMGGRRHIVNCSSRHLFGADADTGQLLWTRPIPTPYRVLAATPVLWKDGVFATGPLGAGGLMLRIHADTNGVRVETAWTSPLDTGQHGLTVVGDRMYGPFYRQTDRWACLDMISGQVLYETRGLAAGSSIHADGRLYCVLQSGDVCLVDPGPPTFRVCGRFRLAPQGKSVKDCWAHPVLLDGRLYVRYHDTLRCLDVRAPEPELVKNGGMEAPFADGLAAGWVKNCYGSNDVIFAEEPHDFGGGKSAQRVTCSTFATGGVQFHSGPVAVEKGKPYTLRLWLKSDFNGYVHVGVRKHGEPYTRYLMRQVRVKRGREWTPYLIRGEASGSDSACGIYLMFAGTGTLLVDEVSLTPGLHEESLVKTDFPPQKGNRIVNSGFEAGTEGWTPVGGFSLDGTHARTGKFSACVASPGIECRPFPVRQGQRYTLSVWLRAAVTNTRVRLRFFEWADRGGDQPSDRHALETCVTATTEWARYQVSGSVWPNFCENYVARIVPEGTVWADDLQVEEGDATEYAAAAPVEVGAETPTRWCFVGDRVEVTAHISGMSQSGSLRLVYTLEDLWSRPLDKRVRPVQYGVANQTAFKMRQPGMYRVRVQAEGAAVAGEVWFGVFPRRERGLRPDSAFGTHVTAGVPEPSNTLLVSEAMGARWVRLHDFGDFCHWRVVEPQKGVWVWRDAEIDALRGRGFMVLANLGHPPLWAGRKHPDRTDHGDWTDAPPRDLSEWENYVFRTVEHFKGRITHWEVWNEPCWKSFFSGTPEEYAEVLKVAYRAVKRADPQAVVIGGCFSSHAEEWTRRVLARDALTYMDALSYHVYWSVPLTETAAPVVAGQVERFAELMREFKGVKPVYMTEGGIRCPPFASWLPKEGFERGAPFGSQAGEGTLLTGAAAAAGLVRGMVQMLSAGVANICYYYTGGTQGAMPWFSAMANGYYVLTDYDGRPKPTLMAYSALESVLDQAEPLKVEQRNGVTSHLFARGKGTVAVIWSDRALPFDPPARMTVLDLMGNPQKNPTLLPGEPIYLQAPRHAPGDFDKLNVLGRTGRDAAF